MLFVHSNINTVWFPCLVFQFTSTIIPAGSNLFPGATDGTEKLSLKIPALSHTPEHLSPICVKTDQEAQTFTPH